MAAKLVPGGVVCLLSALAFHEIGTQMPHEAWAHSKRPTVSRSRFASSGSRAMPSRKASRGTLWQAWR
jgi:hypothetical protein